jgi:protoporphyrinogen oxidase
MILIYLVLEQPRFSEFDAHYFPDDAIPISRLSEPPNYSGAAGSRAITVLCAELPCDEDSPAWRMSDDQLGQLARDSLDQAGLPVRAPLRGIVTRRLRHAYPIYRAGFEAHFAALDGWFDSIGGLLTFGRQGLFAHDNTHHALAMAYAAVDCLSPDGAFDRARWRRCRESFESHVVED